MTGETDSGKSISVTSTLLPRKSNLAIAHAAATPNAQLHGTAIATTISVSRSAASASGSASAAQYTAAPFERAPASTNASGSTSTSATNAIATAISSPRSHAACDMAARRTSTGGRIEYPVAAVIASRVDAGPSTPAAR